MRSLIVSCVCVAGALGLTGLERADVPGAVRAAVEELAPAGADVEWSRTQRRARTVYAAEWSVDGLEHELLLGANGALIEREDELSAAELDADVLAAARALLGDGELEIERRTLVLYEVSGDVAGVHREVVLAPDGSVLELEDGDDDDGDDDDGDDDDGDDDDGDDGDDGDGDGDGDDDDDDDEIALDAVPAHVLRAAQAALPGVTFTEAEVVGSGDDAVYELEGLQDGREVEVEVSASGTVLEIETDDD